MCATKKACRQWSTAAGPRPASCPAPTQPNPALVRRAPTPAGELPLQKQQRVAGLGGEGGGGADSGPSPAPTVSIGDAVLDSEDKALQQELLEYELRLQELRQRRAASGHGGAEVAPPAAAAAAEALGQQQQEAGRCGARDGIQERPPADVQQLQAARQPSIVHRLVSATGQGCQAVLAMEPGGAVSGEGACWTTRCRYLAPCSAASLPDCCRPAHACPHTAANSWCAMHLPHKLRRTQPLSHPT